MNFLYILILLTLAAGTQRLVAQNQTNDNKGPYAQQRWQIEPDNSISWQVGDDIPHYDHIEMSGEMISCVLRWGVNPLGAFVAERSLVFPMLRTIPNNTHASLMYRIGVDIPSLLAVNGLTLRAERVEGMVINGYVEAVSNWGIKKRGNITPVADVNLSANIIKMRRRIFPSRTKPMLCEQYTLWNTTNKSITINVPSFVQETFTDARTGVDGSYIIRSEIIGSGTFTLNPADSLMFDALFQGFCKGESPLEADISQEFKRRQSFVTDDIDKNLILETPDEVINTEFRYAKLRAAESIFKTKGGYMHSPGGEAFYAGIWANDQAEYVNPFFPFMGYGLGNESAINSFRHFSRFVNPEYKPIPSSIISQGEAIWNGAGDRGDAAMIAYGAARFAMAGGNKQQARELWPLIEWCLEYCRRNINDSGVVSSDSDELEGRFPAGDANLCTSTLYYDALLSAAALGQELKISSKQLSTYRAQAEGLAKAIESFFGATIQGYETYRYYNGNTLLRSWICMPLIVGITQRAQGTISALFSPQMWTQDGVLTQQESTTFWDRSTLYALRGVYSAGYANKATEELRRYSQRRLLGDHVPYPIEAWPEGFQRHLSAESGLYCRVITEGLFGIRPLGLKSFELTPQIPDHWDRVVLRRIRAFDADFDIIIERIKDKKLNVTLCQRGAKVTKYTINSGETIRKITLK